MTVAHVAEQVDSPPAPPVAPPPPEAPPWPEAPEPPELPPLPVVPAPPEVPAVPLADASGESERAPQPASAPTAVIAIIARLIGPPAISMIRAVHQAIIGPRLCTFVKPCPRRSSVARELRWPLRQ